MMYYMQQYHHHRHEFFIAKIHGRVTFGTSSNDAKALFFWSLQKQISFVKI
jgi:hypothetical protein